MEVGERLREPGGGCLGWLPRLRLCFQMRAVTERRSLRFLAGANGDLFLFLDLELEGDFLGVFMRTIAEGQFF